MKPLRLSLALVVASFAMIGLARADDVKPEGKASKCCEKAATAEKTCTHGCCTTAAKENKNCEKCGGTNETKDKAAS